MVGITREAIHISSEDPTAQNTWTKPYTILTKWSTFVFTFHNHYKSGQKEFSILLQNRKYNCQNMPSMGKWSGFCVVYGVHSHWLHHEICG